MTVTTRRFITSGIALLMTVSLSGVIVAQQAGSAKPPKAPTSNLGTADFRCVIANIDLCADGLIGDGSGYLGTGAVETGAGAHLRIANGELWLGKMTFAVDFRGQGPTLCGNAGQPACRWNWVSDSQAIVDLVEIQSNVVGGLNGDPIDGGLLAIPIGGAGFSRLKITIQNAAEVGFALNFDSENGSTTTAVTRTAVCTWVFTDDITGDGPSNDDAQAFLTSGVRRNRVDEGLFQMPFEMTFTAPGCVPGS